MPKVFGREVSTPVLVLATVATLALVYMVAFPAQDAPAGTARKKPTAKKDDKKDLFLKEDYDAKFAVFNEPAKNAFKPLIVKASTTTANVVLAPNGISLEDTGGEANWAYTGYVVLNDVPQALLENSSTGDGVYVTQGEQWKKTRIGKITPTEITLVGPSGAHTIKLGDPSELKVKNSVVPPGGVAPMNPAPALRGAIGGAVAGGPPAGASATTPDPNAATAIAPGSPFGDVSVQPELDSRAARRGRRRGGRQN